MWQTLGEIVYLLPGDLPEGWELDWAAERPGRPRSEWRAHIEVLTAEGRILLIGVSTDDDLEPTPVEVVDFDPDELVYVLGYTLGKGDYWDGRVARQARLGTDEFWVAAVELSADPDDELLRALARDLADANQLDYRIPARAISAGFEPAGSVNGFPDDVTDYTVSWRPVGEVRKVPTLFINVGSKFYAQSRRALGTDPASAPIVEAAGKLSLEFLFDGCSVDVGAQGVDQAAVRAFAVSLRAHPVDEWREMLGIEG